ncbi:post-transcriptional regulator [Brevibacillus sp. TJ4]|uniref:post-transcriptional regulator n=1 Tax=Brevibacillus sp. TJ4 TaxID=3234853 RepID=UPI003BA38B38
MDQTSKQQWFEEIAALCQSKAEEFALLGYDNVTAEDIWECVCQAYKEKPPLHQMVNDVLSLKPNKYMNYLMLQMYKNS